METDPTTDPRATRQEATYRSDVGSLGFFFFFLALRTRKRLRSVQMNYFPGDAHVASHCTWKPADETRNLSGEREVRDARQRKLRVTA